MLLLAGDVSPLEHEKEFENMKAWVEGDFSAWLAQIPAGRILMTPGNHDFVFETQREWPDLPAEMLIDQSAELGDVKLYAAPWVPTLKEWAFYGDDAKLEASAAAIPDDTDIWLEHGPPYGIMDRLWREQINVGNSHTLSAMKVKSPQVFVCGHIHEGFGFVQHGETLIANISFVDEFYEPKFRHLALRTDGRKVTRSVEDETNPSELWTNTP